MSDELVKTLGLQPHPEGGYFKETFRSPLQVSAPQGTRAAGTAIYYLLPKGAFAAFHRVRSDEVWHFYDGGPLAMHLLDEGRYETVVLGRALSAGERPQMVVRAGVLQAAVPLGDFTLCGCTVAPGFDFADWELPAREELVARYPQHAALLRHLTREPSGLTLRPIRPDDDPAVAAIIRRVMPEFGADGAGFAIHDAEVDTMSAAYQRPRHVYFVVEEIGGRVVGGGGVAPLAGADSGTCELRKMYFLPEARGRGMGEAVVRRCLEAARAFGFTHCYLETLTGMNAAQRLYERLGFKRLSGPLGKTGHFSCDRWYLLEL
jgi:putative acetyltransferase